MNIIKEHRFENNPKEKELVEKFIKEYGEENSLDLIVFAHANNSMSPKDYLSDREKEIVVSTIQWLGSPVGQYFLNTCGFELNEKTK